MSPQEFWILLDKRVPAEAQRSPGGLMSRQTYDRLREMLH
jgi:microcystin degradation protein MlrC